MIINTDVPAQIVVEGDTVSEGVINPLRSEKPLEVTVFNDSVSKTFSVPASVSVKYYLNIIQNLGIGMLVDKNRTERYKYPARIFVNLQDSSQSFYDNKYYGKPKTTINIVFPWINGFHFVRNNGAARNAVGFTGLGFGVDHWIDDTRFLNFEISSFTDFEIFVPAPITYGNFSERQTGGNISVSLNHQKDKFSWGYGLGLNRYYWSYNRFDVPGESRSETHWSFGPVFPFRYSATPRIYFLGAFRPTLFRSNTDNSFKYEHTISLGFGWKLGKFNKVH